MVRSAAATAEDSTMDKVVITVVGKDTIGILAKTCTYLADHRVNILDISQTIVQDYFNMMMIADVKGSVKPFNALNSGTVVIPQTDNAERNTQKINRK